MGRSTRKRDNSGITLLEVIIAVSIFSIAAVVLLQGFVTSGKINKKSNLYMEATSTAQNIMEEIKAKDFEDVALAFNYPLDTTTGESRFSFLKGTKNSEVDIKELIPVDPDNKKFKSVDPDAEANELDSSSIRVEDTDEKGMVYIFNPKVSSQYYFQINNIKNNHETFDALIEFDGVDAEGGDSGGIDSGANNGKYKGSKTGDKKNDQEIPNIALMDKKENVFLILDEVNFLASGGSGLEYERINGIVTDLNTAAENKYNEEKEAFEQLNKDDDNPVEYPVPAPTPVDCNEISRAAVRTITIDVSNDGEKVEYEYLTDISDYVEKNKDKFGDLPEDKIKVPVKDALGGKKGLKGVYLFYYPNYASTGRSREKTLDNIIFNNKENLAVDFYISKQRPSEEILNEENINLFNAEQNYRVNLEIHEKDTDASISAVKGNTRLRTNLNYNLAEDIQKRKEMSMFNGQMLFSFWWSENKTPIQVPPDSRNRIVELVDFRGLDSKDVKDRIYKVTITIYKHTEDKEKIFAEENKILSIDGSKDD